MINSQRLQRALLLVAGLILIPDAFNYGLNPQTNIPLKFGFDVTSINLAHILRTIMTLYLGMAALWILGFIHQKIRLPALYSLVFFMLSIACGRLLSLVVDGIPSTIFFIFLAVELTIGLSGLILLLRENKNN